MLVIATSSLIAACSGNDPQPRQATSPTTTSRPVVVTEPPTTSTTVRLPSPAPVDWRACGGGFECGRVDVPVDYQDPSGPTLELALVRNPADDPAQRIGTLLVNPGGPGASGVRRVERGFRISDEVAARFDIVGFDPRGVGASSPIACGASVPAFRAEDLSP